MCDDGELYICKTTFIAHPPLGDLINEILCNYLLQAWGLETAEPCMIKIPQVVYDSFIESGNTCDNRYKNFDFDNKLFFGVKYLPNITEFEKYNTSLNDKREYNKFADPIDLIRIGVFDLWIGNKDRRPNNPNILISIDDAEKFTFIPIDHTQVFGYQDNYKAIRTPIMEVEKGSCILSTPISKSILNFAGSKILPNLDKDLLERIKNSINELDFIFEQIPAGFGLSKKGKEKVKEILSNENRNIEISKSFLRFI